MEYGPLAIFLTITVVGFLIAMQRVSLPQIQDFSPIRKMLLGLFIVEMGGLAASAWTWMIHNQLVTGASNLCAAEGIVQCGSVIGDPTYSTFFGVPWGVVGIFAFSALGWLTLSSIMDMKADWAKQYVDFTWYLILPGILGVVWLVLVELFLVEGAPHICPYCTSVHISILVSVFLLTRIRGMIDDGVWDAPVQRSKAELLAEARSKK
ncbi:MAG: vitamin K epoxide reductase family protein [Candidatus Thermoplasmatota archaeon]|nr:vitamin K epoxide reductase family protein [Candidatus Thermoplasmatota archaeon]